VLGIGGEAGDGIITLGELFTRGAARDGLHVYTFRTYPAEVRGGLTYFQVRMGRSPILNQGDLCNILVAFSQEAYEYYGPALPDNAKLLYDSDEYTPEGELRAGKLPMPLTSISRTQVGSPRSKNIVALGAMAQLFGLPIDSYEALLKERFGGKSEAALKSNLLALEMGFAHAKEHFKEPIEGGLPTTGSLGDRLILSGNEALVMGALQAGCRFFAGYPITPASDILERMAALLPRWSGTAVQMEDEISAVGAVVGAAFGGTKAMTATSGPGFSLMTEFLGLASMAEIPIVIADIQRAGPSTGMPTKTEQGDLYQAMLSSHGDAPRIVIAPSTVEDCFYETMRAFGMAERYQMPVIILSDQSLGHRVETVPTFDPSRVLVWDRVKPEGLEAGQRYARFRVTPSGISPSSVPGEPHIFSAGGLEHNEYGEPNYEPENHQIMSAKRHRKIETAMQENRSFRLHGDRTAKVGIVGWGSTEGAVREAIARAAAKGLKASAFYSQILNPLPESELRSYLDGLERIIVPEMNYAGQFASILRSRFGREVIRLNKVTGIPFTPAEVFSKIGEVCRG